MDHSDCPTRLIHKQKREAVGSTDGYQASWDVGENRVGFRDRPEPTFRHEMTPSYKAQRESAPDILRQQMGLVREVLEALKIPSIEVIGFEADDIIATLATQGT